MHNKIKPVVVLIGGDLGAGKDFCADKFIKEYNTPIKIDRLSFIEPMKRIMAKMFGVSVQQLEYWKRNNSITLPSGVEISFRAMMQRLGSDAIKPEFGKSVWAKAIVKHIKKSNAAVILIPDFRFLVEYEYLKETISNKIITVKIFNPDIINNDTHSSETELRNFDFDLTITNRVGTKPDLHPIYLKCLKRLRAN